MAETNARQTPNKHSLFIDFLSQVSYNRIILNRHDFERKRIPMITIHKQLNLSHTYPLERIGPLKDLLFFDIETTGFSGDYANLYLIGCTYWENGSWNLIQWFADTRESEPELLDSFFAFLENYKILIHFNGDGFDIPFLLKRCKKHKMSYDFSAVQSIDIYKKIKPCRKLLGLDSLKQKAIEQFLGISRKDRYSGGELIEVYQQYLSTGDQGLYELLILHNEDDLKGMPAILPILSYPDLLEHPLRLSSQQILIETYADGSFRHLLELVCETDYPVPVPFSHSTELVTCRIKNNSVTFLVTLYDGVLKHFYPNYKDYYYLIHQDRAVHKSIGELIEKDARVKATARTCYIPCEGCFVPQFEPIWEPALKEDFKDKLSYAAVRDVCLKDPQCFQAYTSQLFRHLQTTVQPCEDSDKKTH